jgi:hypothetical protein
VLPALPVTLFPHAIFVAQFAEPAGERLASTGEIGETLEKVAHMPRSLCVAVGPSVALRVAELFVDAHTEAGFST